MATTTPITSPVFLPSQFLIPFTLLGGSYRSTSPRSRHSCIRRQNRRLCHPQRMRPCTRSPAACCMSWSSCCCTDRHPSRHTACQSTGTVYRGSCTVRWHTCHLDTRSRFRLQGALEAGSSHALRRRTTPSGTSRWDRGTCACLTQESAGSSCSIDHWNRFVQFASYSHFAPPLNLQFPSQQGSLAQSLPQSHCSSPSLMPFPHTPPWITAFDPGATFQRLITSEAFG
jgi:hypothetical protein